MAWHFAILGSPMSKILTQETFMKKLGIILLLTLTSLIANAQSELVDPTTEDTQNLCLNFNDRSEGFIKCQAHVKNAIDQLRLSYIVYYVSDHTNETLNKEKLQKLVSSAQAYHPNILSRSVAKAINSVANLNELKELMFMDLDTAILPIYRSTPIVELTK